MRLIIFTVFLFPAQLMAQSPTPTPAVLGAIAKVDAAVPAALPAGIVMVVLFIIDLIARKFPSANPQGVLHWISSGFKGIANVFAKLAAWADQLLGQNVQK